LKINELNDKKKIEFNEEDIIEDEEIIILFLSIVNKQEEDKNP
jgi:hypothetical protein